VVQSSIYLKWGFGVGLWASDLRRKDAISFFLRWHYKGVFSSSQAQWAPMLRFIIKAMNPEHESVRQ
jgi:hypothetical protein